MKFIRAIYDPSLYQESLSERFSKPLFYWIGISLLSIFITGAALVLFAYKTLPSLEEIKQSIPYFEITDGVLEIEKREEIYLAETPILILVDDEYIFNEEELKYTPQFLIATKEIMYIKGEDGSLQQIAYNDIEWLRNTNRDALINNIKDIIPAEAMLAVIIPVFVFFVFMIFLVLIVKFIPILLWALVGLITSKIFKKNLTYGELIKIMLYGNTLPTIVGTMYYVIFKNDINMLIFFALVTIYTGYFIYKINTGKTVIEGTPAPATPVTIQSPEVPLNQVPVQTTPMAIESPEVPLNQVPAQQPVQVAQTSEPPIPTQPTIQT